MKILVVSQYYYPENFRINGICEELIRRGHTVTVLAGIPNYPGGTVFRGYEESYKKSEYINGVEIIRVHNRPRKKGLLHLAVNYLTYAWLAEKRIKKLPGDYDLVYVYQLSPVFMISAGARYSALHGVPLLTYVCDIWPDSVLGHGISVRNPVYVFIKHISGKLYNRSDAIGVKCNEFTAYLADVCGVDKRKCKLIYEHAEPDYLQVDSKPTDNGVTDFMFAGNFGYSSNCTQIIKAAALLKGNFLVHFVGDGSDRENMARTAEELHIKDRIVFHGSHPVSGMIGFYNCADVCLLTLTGGSVTGMTPPAKLPGYMAACRPVIASVSGAAKTIIEDAGCGFVCEAGSTEKLAELMQKVIDDPSAVSGMGEKGREYFLRNFTLKKHVDELEDQFLTLIKA